MLEKPFKMLETPSFVKPSLENKTLCLHEGNPRLYGGPF